MKGAIQPRTRINLQCSQDGYADTFQIGEDILVRKSDHTQSKRLHVIRPRHIVIDTPVVRITVQLDDERSVMAIKVCDEWADGDLASKFQAVESPGSQDVPQQLLCRREIETQVLRTLLSEVLTRWKVFCHEAPSP